MIAGVGSNWTSGNKCSNDWGIVVIAGASSNWTSGNRCSKDWGIDMIAGAEAMGSNVVLNVFSVKASTILFYTNTLQSIRGRFEKYPRKVCKLSAESFWGFSGRFFGGGTYGFLGFQRKLFEGLYLWFFGGGF